MSEKDIKSTQKCKSMNLNFEKYEKILKATKEIEKKTGKKIKWSQLVNILIDRKLEMIKVELTQEEMNKKISFISEEAEYLNPKEIKKIAEMLNTKLKSEKKIIEPS